jgi:hypothetical protein
MIQFNNPATGERYTVSVVPMDKALEMKRNGQVFYDYTKLTAVNTCPTYGVLRYALHKTEVTLNTSGRRMALEAGHACHEFYAALRLWTILERADDSGSAEYRNKILDKGHNLFGKERLGSMLSIPQDSDRINNAQLFALDALHSTGFYDDPSDRRRTMANMEAACLAYTHRYFQSEMPILVEGDVIGIEVPFVLAVTVTRPWTDHPVFESYDQTHYYCGRIDGIQLWNNNPVVCENKTSGMSIASSNAWRMAFALSNQVTGYCIAGSALLGREVREAFVMGSQIPPPRNVFDGTVFELCTRTDSDCIRWCEWFFHSVGTYEAFVSRPTEAPRYSHSCNRFFSSCEFIPFCAATREDQITHLEDMAVDEWSPLDHLTEQAVEGAD